MNYIAKKLNDIDNGEGHWKYGNIGVFEVADDGTEKQVGGYTRKYSSFYDTFFAFQQKDKWYALYSSDYTATSVMSLPDCKQIATEPGSSWGFCPTGFYVPSKEDLTHRSIYHLYEAKGELDKAEEWFSKNPENKADGLAFDQWLKDNMGTFGFVCGCVWGDDHSWKIQYLDLTKITEGVVTREARYGYVEQPNTLDLKECFDWSAFWPDSKMVDLISKKSVYVGERDQDWELNPGDIYQFREDCIFNGAKVKIIKGSSDAALVEVIDPKHEIKKEEIWIEEYQFDRYARKVYPKVEA